MTGLAENDLAISKGQLPHRLDDGIASRAAIGVIVLATDQTMEHEFRRLLDLPGVAFYESRILNEAAIIRDAQGDGSASNRGGRSDPAWPAA
jgi:hypothetical protein